MNEYLKQANEFLTQTGTVLTIKFVGYKKHFTNDECPRDVYTCTLKRGSRSYTFQFGQSIMESMKYKDKSTGDIYLCDGFLLNTCTRKRQSEYFLKTYCIPIETREYDDLSGKYKTFLKGKSPNAYDVLSYLTGHDPGDFENFCDDFGYDSDSISAYKIYQSVKKEYEGFAKLFNEDELELLADIQ